MDCFRGGILHVVKAFCGERWSQMCSRKKVGPRVGPSFVFCLESLTIPGRGQAETMSRTVFKGHLTFRSILTFWLLVLIC